MTTTTKSGMIHETVQRVRRGKDDLADVSVRVQVWQWGTAREYVIETFEHDPRAQGWMGWETVRDHVALANSLRELHQLPARGRTNLLTKLANVVGV